MIVWNIVVAVVFLADKGINNVKAQEAPVCEDDLLVIPQEELQQLLPPSPVWDDTNSLDFIVETGLMTPAEASNFTETATYEEVTNFFTELATLYPTNVQVSSLAQVANGQDVWLVTVSSESFDSMTKPIFYATGGIHPGESSGVNAGMVRI